MITAVSWCVCNLSCHLYDRSILSDTCIQSHIIGDVFYSTFTNVFLLDTFLLC